MIPAVPGEAIMKKKVFAIIGSASKNSSNLKLVLHLVAETKQDLDFTIFDDLSSLPHFDPELSTANPPLEIINFRSAIEKSDAVLICTPEYIFSIPSGLKNAIEWCVSTTVFSGKPVGLITAAASGKKGHDELKMIMRTIEARLSEEASLLIQGVKGKISIEGIISDSDTKNRLMDFTSGFEKLIGA
jgi:chromate reductase